MSQELNIYQRLNNFRTSVDAIRKDKNNTYINYKYADINAILKVITPKLSNAGLIDIDTTKVDENGQVWLETKLINIDNPEEFLKIETPLLMKDRNSPQAFGSALTYARRYNRVTLLGLEQEDDDGNKAEGLDKENANKQNNKQQHPKPNNNNNKQNTIEILKNKKKELSSYLIIKGIPIDAQPNFIEFLKSKNYDVNDLTKLTHLLQNKNLLDDYIGKYLETKLAEAGI